MQTLVTSVRCHSDQCVPCVLAGNVLCTLAAGTMVVSDRLALVQPNSLLQQHATDVIVLII
jgi:hypothetical protein